MQVCLRRTAHCALRQLCRANKSTIAAPPLDTEQGPVLSQNVLSIADQICKLTLMETGQLTALLKDRLGIGEIAIGAAPAAAPVVEAEEEGPPIVEEKSMFNVKLVAVDSAMKIKLIKALKGRLPDLNLVAAKKLVESAPCQILDNVPKAEAEELQKMLQENGAEIALE